MKTLATRVAVIMEKVISRTRLSVPGPSLEAVENATEKGKETKTRVAKRGKEITDNI